MKIPDLELDRRLQSCMEIFEHLIDKDLFADIYRILLAKRLLNERSISIDAEKTVVGMVSY